MSDLQQAAHVLKSGGIVALATETVYGLAVLANDPQAIMRLYQLKKRAVEKTFPIVIANAGQLNHYVTEVNAAAQQLINHWWPGPLTLILPAKREIADALGNHDGSVAVRCSSSMLLQSLLSMTQQALCLTSANESGEPAMLTAEQVRQQFADQVCVLEDDQCVQGVASTIIDVRERPCRVLRQGLISAQQLGLPNEG